ncbi:MAG TPA: IclR family transcriptional regulator [Sediminispirochaeta sp.]|nr:IclR family transcriptional regulator [Sediminispirochaeta sp.]
MLVHNGYVLQDINVSSNSEKKGYVLATTVLKAFRMLEFIGNNQPVQPTDIVRALGYSRANVHRLLATFMEIGYIEKDEDGYGLTFKLFKLGSTVPLSRDLRDVAKPVMIELMKVAEENIYLNVLVENMVIAIDEVKSSHHLTLNPDVTYTYPVHTCASGKVLLSGLPPAQRQAFVSRLDLTKRAPATIVDPKVFLDRIAQAEKEGYATEIREFSDDLNSIAAPIYDYRQQIVATISISGPAMRFDEERQSSVLEPLKHAARRISEKLGNNSGL